MDGTKGDSPEDFHDFAKALVKKLIWRHRLRWDEHRIEDAVQELFLAGWRAKPLTLARQAARMATPAT